MTRTLAEFRRKFQVAELEVVRTPHWTWSLRPAQSTLGAGVLSLNRFAAALAELTGEEAAGLTDIVPTIEHSLRGFSEPDRLNYLMLMMVDAHLHFHVLPRYAQPRTHLGREWIDSGWPGVPSLADNAEVSQDELGAIRDALRQSAARARP
jgi:diadenosine tetraphosphate (Ap4A) HIT family hydrolase